MPRRPRPPCPIPGCLELTSGGQCAKHQREANKSRVRRQGVRSPLAADPPRLPVREPVVRPVRRSGGRRRPSPGQPTAAHRPGRDRPGRVGAAASAVCALPQPRDRAASARRLGCRAPFRARVRPELSPADQAGTPLYRPHRAAGSGIFGTARWAILVVLATVDARNHSPARWLLAIGLGHFRVHGSGAVRR